MQLFTPPQAKNLSNQKHDEDIAQIAYLTVTKKKLQDEITREQDNWNKRLEEMRTVYADEKDRLKKDIQTLEAKIAQGERKLIELLLPVDELKDRAAVVLADSQMEALSLMTREENLKELGEKFTEKLDNLSERELVLSENELKIESRLKGIAEESEMISKNHNRLNDEKEEFEITSNAQRKVLEEKENTLLAKEKANREYLNIRTKELDEQELALKDKRAALDRAFEELKRLKQ